MSRLQADDLWHVGDRDLYAARSLATDMAGRVTGRIQIATGSLTPYLPAIEDAFGWNGTDTGKVERIFKHAPSKRSLLTT